MWYSPQGKPDSPRKEEDPPGNGIGEQKEEPLMTDKTCPLYMSVPWLVLQMESLDPDDPNPSIHGHEYWECQLNPDGEHDTLMFRARLIDAMAFLRQKYAVDSQPVSANTGEQQENSMFTKDQITSAERAAEALNLPCNLIEDDDPVLEFGNHDITRLDDGKFLVCQTSVVPGVRYTSNGDGWPDDVDVQELETFDEFKEALKFAFKRIAEQTIDQVFNAMAEDKFFDEQENFT